MALTEDDLQKIKDIVAASADKLRVDFGADLNRQFEKLEKMEVSIETIKTDVHGLSEKFTATRRLIDMDRHDFEDRISALEKPTKH